MSTTAGFARKVAKSFLVTGVGSAISKVINLVALFVVLKLLSPEELGVATIVLAVFGILQSVTELGLGAALVQAETLTRRQIDSLFWVSLVVSTLFYLLIVAVSPLLVWFYDEPQLAPLLQVQAAAVLLFALYLVPRNLMTKDLWFGRLAIVDNISLLLSASGMVWLAWEGYGAWALIWAEVGNRLGQLILCHVFRPYVPRFTLDLHAIKPMVSFGLYATGSRLLYNFYVNADYLIVGKVFGADAVGIYSLAYRVVSDPIRTLTSIVNQVAYPAFAKLRTESERLKRYYFAIARANMTFIGVALIAICLFIEDALLAADYQQWLPAVPLIQIFSIFGLLRCVGALTPQLLNATGHARLNFLYSLVGAVLMPIGFFVGSRFGLLGVAWAWGVCYPVLLGLVFFFGAGVLQVGTWSFTIQSMAGVPALIPTAAVAIALNFFAHHILQGAPLFSALIGVCGTMFIGFGIGFYLERNTLRNVFRRKAAKDPA